MRQNCLRRGLGASHGAAEGKVDRHILQEIARFGRLTVTRFIQGHINLALKPPLTVPFRFPVAHQQQLRPPIAPTGLGHGGTPQGSQMRRQVHRFQLHRIP